MLNPWSPTPFLSFLSLSLSPFLYYSLSLFIHLPLSFFLSLSLSLSYTHSHFLYSSLFLSFVTFYRSTALSPLFLLFFLSTSFFSVSLSLSSSQIIFPCLYSFSRMCPSFFLVTLVLWVEELECVQKRLFIRHEGRGRKKDIKWKKHSTALLIPGVDIWPFWYCWPERNVHVVWRNSS